MKERIFSLVGFSTQRNNLKTEVLAGLTTFVTMSYILALNPVMFAPLAERGYPIEALFTATALAATIGSLLMAFLAKRPIGQAPGLALNIFFVQTVCVSLGYSWRFALTAVFIEGILFILLCLSNLRQIIFEMIPPSLKFAFAAGIGFFIAMIGFKNSGILAEGTIFNHIDTLTKPSSILFIIGLLMAGVLTVLRVRGGLLLSIVVISLIGIPFGVTTLPDHMANAGHIRKNGRIPYMQQIMLSDALGTVTGACLGCSTVTTYVESAVGVAEGGRTGMTSLVIGLCFLFSLFLSPLFLAIPAAATAPVMVIAGFCLFGSVRHISLTKPVETLPSFLTILMMTVSGSITDGIIVGLFTYVAFSFIDGWINRKKTKISD